MEMSLIALATITLLLVSILLLFKFVIKKSAHGSKNLPKGFPGLPLIGETLSFAYTIGIGNDQSAEWIYQRVAKFEPIFKTSIACIPVVFIVGLAGNKFVLGSSDDVFSTNRPKSLRALLGHYSIFELSWSR